MRRSVPFTGFRSMPNEVLSYAGSFFSTTYGTKQISEVSRHFCTCVTGEPSSSIMKPHTGRAGGASSLYSHLHIDKEVFWNLPAHVTSRLERTHHQSIVVKMDPKWPVNEMVIAAIRRSPAVLQKLVITTLDGMESEKFPADGQVPGSPPAVTPPPPADRIVFPHVWKLHVDSLRYFVRMVTEGFEWPELIELEGDMFCGMDCENDRYDDDRITESFVDQPLAHFLSTSKKLQRLCIYPFTPYPRRLPHSFPLLVSMTHLTMLDWFCIHDNLSHPDAPFDALQPFLDVLRQLWGRRNDTKKKRATLWCKLCVDERLTGRMTSTAGPHGLSAVGFIEQLETIGCEVTYSNWSIMKLDCVSVENNVVHPPPLHPVVRRMAEELAAVSKYVEIIYGGVRLPERWSFLPPFSGASELTISFSRSNDELLDVHDNDFSTIPNFLINEPERYPNVEDLTLERIGRSTGGDSVITAPPNPLSRIMTNALPSFQRLWLNYMGRSTTANCLLYLKDRTEKLEKLGVYCQRVPVELPPLVLAPPLAPPVKELSITQIDGIVSAASMWSLFKLALLLMPDMATIMLWVSPTQPAQTARGAAMELMQCVRRCGQYYDVQLPIPEGDPDGDQSPTFIVEMTKKAAIDRLA
ncbi:unnamed protein product [Vitrella brassicaformis CCMP3155]|uniref:Uncharacterized protein n=1 Tax=Vitrella brassicaformis (strain CCMP3155) TaxID=1169540 RepID=A0A0G4GCC7_VITBC|nr:unnamed protein product [Vitrella brassicaformis CCMP3155]|eukprot:CEM26953.1 unnamed protein product [Vitrella brassicaformis CCMP3155]